MVSKIVVAHNKNNVDELLNINSLVERLKRLRALNREPERIGLTQYTWRSFSIDKTRRDR